MFPTGTTQASDPLAFSPSSSGSPFHLPVFLLHKHALRVPRNLSHMKKQEAICCRPSTAVGEPALGRTPGVRSGHDLQGNTWGLQGPCAPPQGGSRLDAEMGGCRGSAGPGKPLVFSHPPSLHLPAEDVSGCSQSLGPGWLLGPGHLPSLLQPCPHPSGPVSPPPTSSRRVPPAPPRLSVGLCLDCTGITPGPGPKTPPGLVWV